MTIAFTPSWTDDATDARKVIAPQCLARGSVVRGTLDLSTNKFGAYLFAAIGRGGVTALTNGVNVEIRGTLNAGAILMPGAPIVPLLSDSAAAILKLVNLLAGYPAGTSAFEVDGTGTPAADEDYCCWGVTAIPAGGVALPNLEFVRVSKFSGTTLTIDSPCKIAKIDNEILTSKASQWGRIWVPGPGVIEIIFDYGDDAAGESVAVACYAQVLNREVAA
jgi:hypothetical protein